MAADIVGASDAGAATGAILAGGRATRFGGTPKGLELVGGARIVDRVVAALREVTTSILLVGAPAAVSATLPDCRPIPDEAPGNGPLGAIITALRASGGDVLIVAWDMPFVTAGDLRPLFDAGGDADAVVWESDGRLEPLCAIYRATALETLTRAFAEGERSPREALSRLRLQVLRRGETDEPSPFASVNTAEQLDAVRRLVSFAAR